MHEINIRKISVIDHGFSGFAAKGRLSSQHGVVIILGGESVVLPFLKAGKAMAKKFAEEGFFAVSVSLFGAKGLPDSPDQVPLEYALAAVDYVKKVEKCTRISVFGMSMGSIVALGTAVYREDVDDLIMMSPSHVAFEGVSRDKKTMKGRSFLTFNANDIPYVRADFSKYKMHEAYENAYADKEREASARAALPITEAKSRVLLLAGEKDSFWPSAYSVRLLYDLLEKSKAEHSFSKVIYPEYGHLLPLKKEVMHQVFSWLKETAPSPAC